MNAYLDFNFGTDMRTVIRLLEEIVRKLDQMVPKENQVHISITGESICEHAWVLQDTSTGGESFQCAKCGAWKYEPVYQL